MEGIGIMKKTQLITTISHILRQQIIFKWKENVQGVKSVNELHTVKNFLIKCPRQARKKGYLKLFMAIGRIFYKKYNKRKLRVDR